MAVGEDAAADGGAVLGGFPVAVVEVYFVCFSRLLRFRWHASILGVSFCLLGCFSSMVKCFLGLPFLYFFIIILKKNFSKRELLAYFFYYQIFKLRDAIKSIIIGLNIKEGQCIIILRQRGVINLVGFENRVFLFDYF